MEIVEIPWNQFITKEEHCFHEIFSNESEILGFFLLFYIVDLMKMTNFQQTYWWFTHSNAPHAIHVITLDSMFPIAQAHKLGRIPGAFQILVWINFLK